MRTTEGGSTTVVLVVDGVETVIWRLDDRVRPDLAFVDALARLQLAARRRGWSLQLRNPGAELLGVLELVGLADVLGGPALSLEARGEAEGGKQLGIEEVVDRRDPGL